MNIQNIANERAIPDRLRHAGPDGVQVDPTGRQRIVAAPLDRLLASGFITQREFDSGDRLRADAYLAGIEPGAPTVDWSAMPMALRGRLPSMFSSQHIADARIRFRRLKQAMGGVVWDVLNVALILERDLQTVGQNIFGVRNHGEAVVAGKAGFRVALGALADAYERGT